MRNEVRNKMCWKSTYLMVNQKCEGISAFQDKRSVQSKLAIWDLGIIMGHEKFGLKVAHINGDDLFNDVCVHITYEE